MRSSAARVFFMLAVVGMFAFGAATYGGYQVVIQSRTQSQLNGTLLKILLGVSGCTITDTPAECQARQDVRAAEQGRTRVLDVECRIRLALAGMPSPPAGGVCVPPGGP